MIAAWMIYTLGVSLLLCAAARAAEIVTRAFRLPARWLWLGALMTSLVVSSVALVRGLDALVRPAPSNAGLPVRSLQPVVITILPTSTPTRAPRPALGLTVHNMLVDGRSVVERAWSALSALDVIALERWNAVLLGGWLIVSSVIVAGLGTAVVRLRRMEQSFSRRVIGGEIVFVSNDVGPAVFGVFTPRIVVPEWVFTLSHVSRAKVYEHERAHVEASDPALLCLGYVAVALQPWNVALWLMLGRLRPAIESDCDQRVIGDDAASVGEYARLILSVYERCAVHRAPYMAFAARPSNLERRIRHMTNRRRRSSVLVIASAATAVVLTATAWMFAVPDLHATQHARASTTSYATTNSRSPNTSLTTSAIATSVQASRRHEDSSNTRRLDGQAYRLKLVDSTIHLTRGAAVSAKQTSAPACHISVEERGLSPGDCTIDGAVILYAIDSSHILVAFQNPRDTTGAAPYMIYGSRSTTVPQIRWRSFGHSEIRERELVIRSAASNEPVIVIGSDDAQLHAHYPNARVFVASSRVTYYHDPGIDWNMLWELPVSPRCATTYPLSPPTEAEFRDSTHAGASPSYACVVQIGQALRVVKY